jgi:hypothetical protein
MLPQLDRCSKNCIRMCAIYQHKFVTLGGTTIPAALIVHYTSTTTATAKTLGFNVKTDQRVSFSCARAHARTHTHTHTHTHTMKILVQKMFFFFFVETVLTYVSYKIMPSSKGTLSVNNNTLET